MLTSLQIENFKGISKRQRIEFAPLTLLFGANSAGKSTIMQALLYLQELLERGNADVDRTELGGQVLELGGFARLVHGHDTTQSIKLRAEFDTPGYLEVFDRNHDDFPFRDLDDDVESAWIELTIGMVTTPTFTGPAVEEVHIGVNGERMPLLVLMLGGSLRDGDPLYALPLLGHPVLRRDGVVPQAVIDAWAEISIPPESQRGVAGKDLAAGLPTRTGALSVSRSRLSALPPLNEPISITPFAEDSYETDQVVWQVRTFLEMVVVGTSRQLAQALREALYIGPLRAVPPRGFLYERPGRVMSWTDGLAAWDLLLADRLTLAERTNAWLRRLDAGCEIEVQQLVAPGATAEDTASGSVDQTVRRLLLKTRTGSLVLPSEVGAGISQLVPVIVAALTGRTGLTLMEQPELHVHPALQVGLGDLLIEAAGGGKRAFVIETHSEHLILRLLRRIRETTDGELAEGAPAFTGEKLSVLYVEATTEGVRVTRLRVDDRGEFVDRWPKGFFAERMGELL